VPTVTGPGFCEALGRGREACCAGYEPDVSDGEPFFVFFFFMLICTPPVLPSSRCINRTCWYRENPVQEYGCCSGDTGVQVPGTKAVSEDLGAPVCYRVHCDRHPFHEQGISVAYYPVPVVLPAGYLRWIFRMRRHLLFGSGKVLSGSALLFLSALGGSCMNQS